MNRAQRTARELQNHCPNSADILDVGCGFGETLVELNGLGFKNLTGLDYDDGHLQVSRQRLKTSKLILGDAHSLPFTNHVFDAVVCLDVLEHLADDARAAKEISRVLKSGGRLVITVPHFGHTRFLDPANLWYRLTGQKSYHKHYTAEGVKKLLEPGFSNFVIEKRGLGLAQLVHILSYPLRKFPPTKAFFELLVSAIEAQEYKLLAGKFGYHLFVAATKN